MLRTMLVGFISLALLAAGCGEPKGNEEEDKDQASGNDGSDSNPAKLLGTSNTPGASNNAILLSMNRAEQFKLQNNLKQVIFAMHSYHDQHRNFPPGGEGGLSWRVRLLPMLGHGNLYNQFNLDEPWDSEHNKQLISQMPETYKTTSEQDITSMMIFVGNGALYDGSKPPSMVRVTDGTSNTIAVVIAGADKAVPWTKPVDLRFDPSDPYAALGNVGNTLLYANVDGSTYMHGKSSIPAETLKAMITKSGHEAYQRPR